MPIYTTEGYRITQGVCKSDHFPSSNTHARSIHFMDFLYKIPSMRAFNSPLSCRINSECIHDRVSPQSAMFLRGSKLHGLTLCNLIWINVHFTLHIFLHVGAATHRHDRGLFICDSASGRSSLFYRLYGKRPCRRSPPVGSGTPAFRLGSRIDPHRHRGVVKVHWRVPWVGGLFSWVVATFTL